MVGSSEGQTPTRIMKGVKAFEYNVDTDKPSRACGIVKASIQDQVLRIARSVGLHLRPVDARASVGHLAINLTLITKHGIFTTSPNETHQWSGDVCATSIRLAALAPPKASIEATRDKGLSVTVLWAQEVLEAGNIVGHGFRVERAVRELTRQFAMDWALDNRP
jgi:hypothetical protein